MIEYREFCFKEYKDTIKSIYEKESWLAYLRDDAKLERAFDNSLLNLGAFEGERLLGFVRCVGDGEHILLVQDLIVDRDFQKQGIGSILFKIFTQYILSSISAISSLVVNTFVILIILYLSHYLNFSNESNDDDVLIVDIVLLSFFPPNGDSFRTLLCKFTFNGLTSVGMLNACLTSSVVLPCLILPYK